MAGLWSVALRALLEGGSRIGVDPDELCRRCDIDRSRLSDPDHRVPLDRAARIWPEASRMYGRPGFGLQAGAAIPFGTLEALDYAFATASTVADGLARTVGYFDVVTGGATRMKLQRSADGLVLVFLPLPGGDLRDYGVALSVRRLSWAGVVPSGVSLRGGPVAAPAEYADTLGCPVQLDADASAVAVRAADAARPLEMRFPGLRDVVERDLARVLARCVDGSDPLDEVRREVVAALGPDGPTLTGVARRLGQSGRTLQRRLAGRGTTFKELLDEVRHSMAREHLERDHHSVAEIAYLLGFSEPSAFSRAFHRWTGEWPADFRARSRAS